MADSAALDPRYQQLWQSALSDLQGRISRANYETWLRSTTLLGVENGVATVAAPNAFAVDQLRLKFDDEIVAALSAIANRRLTVEYVVGGQGPASAARAPKPKTRPTPPASRATKPDDPAPRPESHQMTLTADARPGLNPGYTFDTFVVGPSNRLAHAASMAVGDKPAQAFNPLFIYGGVGLGKTHLMHAVGHRAIDQRPETSVLYVSSEKFTNDLIKSIMGQRTDEFRDRYRSADILMIDDIQFIAGKEATQEEFFHTFNDLFQSGRQIIVSSDRPPKAIPTLAERLRSRFEGGLIVDVQPPDIETRTAILSRKGQSLGVHVPNDVLEYVARKVQSNIRELEGALNKIIALAQLFNAPIRMDIASQALNDAALEARRAQITPERVLAEVMKHYKATLADLRGRGRSKEVVLPRQVAMYVLREETGSSLVEIGALLGGRDHSTVMHGIGKIEHEIETNTALRQQVSTIREALYG
ncbi:MAG TPA: chromosomal replication initiator protein DnaA [Thermomicrobiales bacterium]|nr:chromosomal replication initiator protein DnaA [Chloroflexota bacterium]HQZ90598.1 chromosomal replication initiator protein DnaA [Thermomicrobiales bacterium]HRA31980.1 chromosomal replication initiator protein DnaA [Thermomicrobiales bacterium]